MPAGEPPLFKKHPTPQTSKLLLRVNKRVKSSNENIVEIKTNVYFKQVT